LQSEIEPHPAVQVSSFDKTPKEVKLEVKNLYGGWNEV
jgi:ABC-type multidrug transport system fused ATPase/permease subunit